MKVSHELLKDLQEHLRGKTYKKMIANDNKSYLSYFNNLVDEYNDTYHRSIGREPVNADHSILSDKIDPKAPKVKVSDRARITKYKNIFSKGYTKNWSEEIFIIEFVLKTNL